MPKELSSGHDPVSCDVCGRTLLKGEHAEPYLVRDGGRRLVCELCRGRAEASGWIRESARYDVPPTTPGPDRGSLLARLRRRRQAEPAPAEEPAAVEEPAEASHGGEAAPWREDYEDYARGAAVARSGSDGGGPRDPRHVRAVPAGVEAKVGRALELFNESEHARTVAGLVRTLGPPWVSALPVADAPSEVSIVVAWELSWYQFRVDLSDESDPVAMVAKGNDLGELDEALQSWNASADADGALVAGSA